MMYIVALTLSLALGYLTLRALDLLRLPLPLLLIWSLGLGFGLVSHLGFISHILLNAHGPLLPLMLTGLTGIALFIAGKKKPLWPALTLKTQDKWGLGLLALLAIPLTMEALHYPLGGWDAWSCWNLKARFIFLGQDHWKDMLDPVLWRSNTHYPLLLPLMNVFCWDLLGQADQNIPMINSIIFSLLTAGVMCWGIFLLTGRLLTALALTALPLTLPFFITLAVSQYSDILIGFYLISAILCWLGQQRLNMPGLKVLCGLFLGLLSFTKTEGLVAAALLSALIIVDDWRKGHFKDLPGFLFALGLMALPTVIFNLAFAPHNEAFINGFSSAAQPSDITRLQVIAVYPWFEMISGKWNGWWLLMIAGLVLSGKKSWQGKQMTVGIFVILYIGVILAYYWVNTFFPIVWWMQTTLSRIIFALIPTITLWVAASLIPDT